MRWRVLRVWKVRSTPIQLQTLRYLHILDTVFKLTKQGTGVRIVLIINWQMRRGQGISYYRSLRRWRSRGFMICRLRFRVKRNMSQNNLNCMQTLENWRFYKEMRLEISLCRPSQRIQSRWCIIRRIHRLSMMVFIRCSRSWLGLHRWVRKIFCNHNLQVFQCLWDLILHLNPTSTQSKRIITKISKIRLTLNHTRNRERMSMRL